MATVTWVDSYGNWTSGANWDTGSPPGPTDDAVVNNGGTATVTTSIAVNSITVSGSTPTSSSTIDVEAPGETVTVSANLIIWAGSGIDQISGGGGSTVN